MSYEKQNFADGQVLKAEHLTKMEQGIIDSVSTTEQTLTEDQKSQARQNLGFEVVKFALDVDANTLTCLTHEAAELGNILMSGIPITGFLINQDEHIFQTVSVGVYGFGQIQVGCAATDSGWLHQHGNGQCYVDGDIENCTIGNEQWCEY